MAEAAPDKRSWIATVARGSFDLVVHPLMHTVRLKRLFSLSNRAVDARARLDTVQKAVVTQRRQIGDARQGIAEAEQALATLQDEITDLSRQFGDIGKTH